MCVIAKAAFGDKSPEVMDNFDEDFEDFGTICDVESMDSELVIEVLQMQKMKNLKHKNPQSNFWKKNKLNEDI